MISIKCSSCGHHNEFDQPAIHAGFSDQGFLYNDEGNLTLVWSTFDPAYRAIVGKKHPWMLAVEDQNLLEDMLKPAPSGGQWRFKNPARCMKCSQEISGPMIQKITYLLYPGSVIANYGTDKRILKEFLLPPRT